MAINHLFIVANGELSDNGYLTTNGTNQIRFITTSIGGAIGITEGISTNDVEIAHSDEPCASTAALIIKEGLSTPKEQLIFSDWPWTQTPSGNDGIFSKVDSHLRSRLRITKVLVVVLPLSWVNRFLAKFVRESGSRGLKTWEGLDTGDALQVKLVDGFPTELTTIRSPSHEN